jgi:hypothetical protein
MAIRHLPDSGLFPEIEAREFVQSDEVAALAKDVMRAHEAGPQAINAITGLSIVVRNEEIHVLYLLNHKPFDPLKDEYHHDVVAKAIKAPTLWRDVTGYDAVVWIRSYFWTLFEPRKRSAVMLHELLHFEVERDPDSDEVKLRIAHHDVEEFATVMRFYGAIDGARESMVKAFGLWQADGGKPVTEPKPLRSVEQLAADIEGMPAEPQDALRSVVRALASEQRADGRVVDPETGEIVPQALVDAARAVLNVAPGTSITVTSARTGESFTAGTPLCVNGACALEAGHDGPCKPPSIDDTAAPDEADDDSDDLLP